MKTFQIAYKYRYGEAEDWGNELIKAKTKREALEKFSRKKRIFPTRKTKPSEWIWNEGVWSTFFKSIQQVELKACPHCKVLSVVPIHSTSSR
jgi:hypothetical protein